MPSDFEKAAVEMLARYRYSAYPDVPLTEADRDDTRAWVSRPTGSALLARLREAVLEEAARECDRVTRIYEHDTEGIGAAACANGIRALAAGEKVPR